MVGDMPLAKVVVQDQGIGIPAAEIGRVFDRFYRGSQVVGRMPGTGLGLSGVKLIVEAHGGQVQAQSVEGEGSTFTVRLPCLPHE
jgi:signal transduction histidine kinase